MGYKSYAQTIENVQVMLHGLESHVSDAEARGFNAEKIAALKANLEKMITLNNEQESLKSALKLKTAELIEKTHVVEAEMSEATKVVKLAFPQASWVEFGMKSRR